jgi:hypothetical protein
MPPDFPPPQSASPSGQSATPCEWACAAATLGPAHPLVAVLRSFQTAGEQVVVIGSVQAADLIVLLEHAPLGLALGLPLALALACVAVQIALGLRIAYLAWRKRDICRELIIEGREQLPLPTVERELKRLGAPRLQAELAHAIERLTEQAAHPRTRGTPWPPIRSLKVVRAVAPELHEIARVLHGGKAALRGVAHVEALLTSGESPLYGVQAELLRDELGRARFFLAGPTSTRKENP